MTPNASLASEQDRRKACAKSGRENATKTVVKRNRKELMLVIALAVCPAAAAASHLVIGKHLF